MDRRTKTEEAQMTITKSQIIGALPTLTRPELEEIQAVATSLLGGHLSNVRKPATALAGQVFAALNSALKANTSLETLPTNLQQKFERKHQHFIDFLNTDFKGWDQNKVKSNALMVIMLDLLKKDLERIQIKPTYTIMINNLHRMPEVFDDAFPDYRASGLGMVLINKYFKKGDADALASFLDKKLE